MRRWLVIVAIAAQVAVLAYMAGQREWILRHGATLTLRTAPVDPRDAMRGDYIRFDYEIARVSRDQCRDGVKAWFSEPQAWRAVRDRVVYVALQQDDSGVTGLASVSDQRPAAGPFLRGRVSSVDSSTMTLRFGVEARFTEQRAARKFEAAQGDRAGAPVDVDVAVDGNGTAVFKDYRFEPLGIVIAVDRPPRNDAATSGPQTRPNRLRGVTVTLKNYGDRPLAIVAAPDGGSFRLLPNRAWGDTRFRWAGADAVPAKFAPGMVRVLAPGGSYSEHLDLTAPRWAVRDSRDPKSAPMPLGELANGWGTSFRLEYSPPTRAECIGWPDADLIRHARLRSRAFGLGGVD